MPNKEQYQKNKEYCGMQGRLEKHHWRYDKPLLFSTLCVTCHKIQHMKHWGGI